MFGRLFSSGNGNQDKYSEEDLERFRHRMVEDQIADRGLSDQRVLDAMRSVPRHAFVPGADPVDAYDDRPLPIGSNQTISQPYMVAIMTEALRLSPGHSVLEVGTGSGYQTAILAEIADHVYTIERHESLMETARDVLQELGYENISYRVGDGTKGWPEEGPFDRIIVTAGAPSLPDPLVEQLSESSGIMVIPVGKSTSQNLTRVRKTGDELEREQLGSCVFVQLIGDEGWEP